MAINQQDFITPITGNVVIQNNGARLVFQANADLNTLFEGDESFKLLLRKGSNTGPVVATTAVLVVRDTSNTITYNSLVESSDTIAEGDTISFILDTTNLGPNNTLYFNTVGNVTSSLFTAGNTGSFVTTGNAYTLSFTTTSTVPENETRFFRLEIREGSSTGPVKITSNVITIVDALQAFILATGGTEYIENNYKTHLYLTSGNFQVNGLGLPSNRTVQYLVIGSGGRAGASNGASAAGGGGAGGVLTGNLTLASTGGFAMVVGAGAAAPSAGGNAPSFGPSGSNSSIFSNTIVALGGGGGGGGAPPDTTPTYRLAGAPGGSGGGGSPFGSGTPGQGFPGGGSFGGGGGAGGPGEFNRLGGNGVVISWVTEAVPWTIVPTLGVTGPTPGRWFAGGGSGGGNTPITPLGGAGYLGQGGGGWINYSGPSQPSKEGLVLIRYPYTVKTFNLTDDIFQPGAIVEGSNIAYSLRTINVSNNSVLYYTTSGNVTTSDFFGGNTGSFTVVNANASFSISIANNIVSGGDTKEFTLQLREGSTSGPVLASANTVTIYSRDPSNFITATGGTIVKNGSQTLHVFTSSDTFSITNTSSKFNNIEYLLVAGGGSGGQGPATSPERYGGGGGGAGGLHANSSLTAQVQDYTVVVGGGGGQAANGGNTYIQIQGSPPSAYYLPLMVGGGRGGAKHYTTGSGGSGGGRVGPLNVNNDSSTSTGDNPGLGIGGQGNPGGPGGPFGYTGSGGGYSSPGTWAGVNNLAGGAGYTASWVPNSYGDSSPTGRVFSQGGIATLRGGYRIGIAANAFTGGGGMGAGTDNPGIPGYVNGGAGGSGIVIIRYVKP